MDRKEKLLTFNTLNLSACGTYRANDRQLGLDLTRTLSSRDTCGSQVFSNCLRGGVCRVRGAGGCRVCQHPRLVWVGGSSKARSTVQSGGHTGSCPEARGAERHRSFQWLPNQADKFCMWILLIFTRSLDTFPEGGVRVGRRQEIRLPVSVSSEQSDVMGQKEEGPSPRGESRG